jgi:hypothetical protein
MVVLWRNLGPGDRLQVCIAFAAQVIGPGEDPRDYEAFYDALYDDLDPLGAVEDQLAELIIGRFWRLRRVPEIEAGILAYSHFSLKKERAQEKASAQEESLYGLPNNIAIKNESIHDEAEKERNEAATALRGTLPSLAAEFRNAEPVLNRLMKIAAMMEGSVYRAIKELMALQAQRHLNVIDAAVVEEPSFHPRPRHRERPSELN